MGDYLDKPNWNFTKSGIFYVKFLYNKLSAVGVGVERIFKHLWKAKLPLKINIWLCLIWHNVITTNDNMKKQKWVSSYVYPF
jgi:hypothetical protein